MSRGPGLSRQGPSDDAPRDDAPPDDAPPDDAPPDDAPPDDADVEEPERDADVEFGPPGYLPERAASRARKIVLRAPLGIQWVVASLVAGVVIAVVAVVFFTTRGSAAPGPPFERIGTVESVRPADYDPTRDLLVVGAAGRVRSFAVEDVAPRPEWCEESGRLEAPDGRVWSATGRALTAGDSLTQHPTVVVDGVVYVDGSRTEPGPAPRPGDVRPACFAD